MTAYFVADAEHIREITKETHDVLLDFATGYSVSLTPGPSATKSLRNATTRAALAATLGLHTPDLEPIIENLNAYLPVKVFRVSQ